MGSLLREILSYWGAVFAVIGEALVPSAELFAAIFERADQALPVALGVSFVAGVSLLLGQSVILFLNRAGPLRFLLSLLIHGAVITGGLIVTALVLWLVGGYLFPLRPTFPQMLALTAVSYAPLAFGFLILIPYFGTIIEKLLYAWSALILLVVVRIGFQTTLLAALACVGLAFLLRQALGATIGRPIGALRRRLRRSLFGGDELVLSPAEIRARVAARLSDEHEERL